jgi:hypothetical protein
MNRAAYLTILRAEVESFDAYMGANYPLLGDDTVPMNDKPPHSRAEMTEAEWFDQFEAYIHLNKE